MESCLEKQRQEYQVALHSDNRKDFQQQRATLYLSALATKDTGWGCACVRVYVRVCACACMFSVHMCCCETEIIDLENDTRHGIVLSIPQPLKS